MLTQTQLKSLFQKYNFSPLKRFGENYLIDGNVKNNIISASSAGPDDTILEIGPGFGALTFDLASSGAKVFAVEKDRMAFKILGDLVDDDFPNLKIFNEDILKFDLKKNCKGKKIKVIGNLPYYITTPVIEYLIENRSIIDEALIVVQKEVALRLLAPEGSKERASISCFVQYYTRPEYIHTIKRGSFYPAPEVDSSLLRLVIPNKPSIKVNDESVFFRIIRGSFNQRRKSIINSLSREAVLGVPKEELISILKDIGVDPASRPEDLPLASFASISNAVR